MILLLIIVYFLLCYFLHKMSADKGVSPWPYVGGFSVGFFLIFFAAISVSRFFTGHGNSESDDQQLVMAFIPFAMMFQFLLFLYFRKRIDQLPDYPDDDDDTPPHHDDTKKDFSYFR